MKIALGNDQGGYLLREAVLEELKELNCEVIDCGIDSLKSIDYPDKANEVCKLVSEGKVDFGILICGTGIGISIAANRHRDIRCALISDCYSARMARLHNDANIMALGGRVTGPDLAKMLVETFLTNDFSNIERHQNRIDKLS